MPLLSASLQHTLSLTGPHSNQPGPISCEIYNFLLWWPMEYTHQLSVPLPNGRHKAPSCTPRMQTPFPTAPPDVTQAPSSPYGRCLPFLALQNVGVRARAPHNIATPCPRNTPPRSIRRRTRLAAIPGVHGCLPESPAPHPPQARSRGPLPRGRLRGAHSDVPGSRARRRPRSTARAALRSVGRSGRPRPVPRAPRPRPPCYLPAEPHDPVQLGLVLKQVPELPGTEDPKAPRAAGLRPRPRRPGPVHAARPRPQLGCWLGPLGPLRPGSTPLRSGSGIRLRLRPRAPLRRQRAPRPALKGAAARALVVG